MRTTANLALTVWDSNGDTFDHTALASNWDKIDADYARTRPTNSAEVRTTVPATSNFEGRLAYLSAADSGFGAGTLIRYTGGAWKPVAGVELFGALPTSGNFAGRMVLLTSAAGGFAQWSLIRYDGSAWALTNYTYELLSAVPVTANFAGRLVMLTSASGGFNAFDLIRYNGSTWARIGPDPVFPGTEMNYYSQTTDVTTTNAASPGDLITTFGSNTYENLKYYLHVAIPRITLSVAGSVLFLLRDTSGPTIIGNPISCAVPIGGNYDDFAAWFPFTPSAGVHTYDVRWYISTAGTGTINTTSLAPAIFRILKA